jgi:hypothetical protein
LKNAGISDIVLLHKCFSGLIVNAGIAFWLREVVGGKYVLYAVNQEAHYIDKG